MKKLILLIILNIISSTCFSQDDENATTLIFNDNTTIKGFGEVKDNKIYFKLSPDDKPDEWDYDSIKGVIFSGYGFSEKYIYITCDKYSKPGLVLVLEEGNVNLYKTVQLNMYVGMGGMTNNASSNNAGIRSNTYYDESTTFYIKRETEKVATIISNSFKKTALKYFADCDIVITK